VTHAGHSAKPNKEKARGSHAALPNQTDHRCGATKQAVSTLQYIYLLHSRKYNIKVLWLSK
jgi:hypothetical protein